MGNLDDYRARQTENLRTLAAAAVRVNNAEVELAEARDKFAQAESNVVSSSALPRGEARVVLLVEGEEKVVVVLRRGQTGSVQYEFTQDVIA